MPHISVAMARSLGSGWLASRDIAGDVTNVKNSFSSWDGCMAATYCKSVSPSSTSYDRTDVGQVACHHGHNRSGTDCPIGRIVHHPLRFLRLVVLLLVLLVPQMLRLLHLLR
jgi:hypothetical protein